MSISSNSVIHYTNKIENLSSIIKSQGFRLKYCLEDIYIEGKKEFSSAIPMVSFCDIPLSEVKNHIDSYGSYAIGLYKSWAKSARLNPVLYLESNSVISCSILEHYKLIAAKRKKPISEEQKQDPSDIEYFKMLQFCKNYEGHLKHGSIDSENYRFYDEREWRYVPEARTSIGKFPFILWGDTYNSNKDEYNEKLKDIYLEFKFSDISYLIVDDESDIPEILNVLNEIYEDICTSKELKVLGTRIITKNQIYNDF